MNIISSSYGNDSVAMIQWCYENEVEAIVVYIDTGWAAEEWYDRVNSCEHWARGIGFKTVQIRPEVQFQQLMRDKKGFPNQRFQWCSGMLKGIPFLNFVDKIDSDGEAIVLVGKRRVESRERSETPAVTISEYHGDRLLMHPLYRHTDADRDELIARTPFTVLEHRSLECSPCVNANAGDFKILSASDIAKVAALEAEIGKTMFRPKRHNGAQGIRQVIDWAKYGQGKYDPDQQDLFNMGGGSPFGCGL